VTDRRPIEDDPAVGELDDQLDEEPEESGSTLEPAREQPCANHPNRLTYVTCSSCGKPLCPDCMIYSAVGIKCRECARMPRSSQVTLKSHRLLAATAAGLGAGTVVGFVYYYILGAGRFFFLIFFIAAGIGWLVGEAVVRASGYYRGVKTAVIAAASTVWAFVVPPLFSVFLNMGFGWSSIVFGFSRMTGIINWVVMAVAAYFAWHRNR
jgi:hypothetical protein